MPVVHVNVWKGFDEGKIKVLVKKITEAFVDLGVPAHAVEIIVHEIPMSHWSVGGELASEKFSETFKNK